MALKKSRKRTFEESNEFMPLSKGKLFDSDDDNDCEYDWGFKKANNDIQEEVQTKPAKSGKPDVFRDIISKRVAYQSADPLKLKDEDKQMYMDNLSKIYERSYVYIPSFYDADDVLANVNKMIESSTKNMFENEIKSLSDVLDNFWKPLNVHYVETERLSSNCSAFKMIVRCMNQCLKTKSVFEGCLENFEEHAADFRDIIKLAKTKDVESITNIFRDTVGNVLLKYKDDPSVSMDKMARETNKVVFMRMVADDIETVKERVKSVKSRAPKPKQPEPEELEEEEDESTEKVVERPASKSIMENKGLMPRRKKADANPRVKHRMKFKKAIVKYHSQVPRSRDDVNNYEGEQSGIRIGVIKSRKFK